MPKIPKVTDKKLIENVVWNQRQMSQKPDIKPDGKNWLMDAMPFNAMFKEKLTDEKALQYLCEGKFISFKPVGGLSTTGFLRADKRSVAYKDGLGKGISIELSVSKTHWKKLIKIDSLKALGDINRLEFVEFTFEVESDFDIPERENKKPRIRLGENSYIEVSQAWDSTPRVFDDETGETSENKIPVKSFFKREGGKLYFIKQIPTKWLQIAQYPVWTDVDITYGSASEFEDGATVYCRCCEIDTNKFVVVFKDTDDAHAGKARVATVSGTTITWGATSEFDSAIDTSGDLGVCKLDTDKFVVVYAGYTDDGYARVATVSTRTISWGTAKEFVNADMEHPACCQLATDKFAIVYNNEDTGDHCEVCVCTVSGTTITSGTPVQFEDGKTDTKGCCKLDTDKFAVVYRDRGDSDYPKACAFSVSGTIPTAGAIVSLEENGASYPRCAQLDTDKFVVAWNRYGDATGQATICTVSTLTITVGSLAEFSDSTPYGIGIDKIDSTHFAISYQDGSGGNGVSHLCSFSGTTITTSTEDTFNAADTSSADICLISSNKVVVVYRDEADASNIGEAIIGDIPPAVTEKTSSDIGSGADAKKTGEPLATYARSETGSGADAFSGNRGFILAQAGSGVEALIGRAIVLAETGSGLDTLLSLLGKLRHDTGSGVENSYLHILAGVKSSSDTGSGAEVSALEALFQRGDVGIGVEQVIARALFAKEYPTGAIDLAKVLQATILGTGETGTGAEASLRAVFFKRTETGTGVDAHKEIAPLSEGDSGAGVDALKEHGVLGADVGAGVDAHKELQPISVGDSGAGTDLATLMAMFERADSGSGVEAITILAVILASDSGQGVDAVLNYLRHLVDSGVGGEVIQLVGYIGRAMKTRLYTRPYYKTRLYFRPYYKTRLYTGEVKQ